MTPRERILTIRLTERIKNDKNYAKKIGLVVEGKKEGKEE